MKLKDKIKFWYKKNEKGIKEELAAICGTCLLLGVGYCIGSKVTQFAVYNGMVNYRDKGVIKFFDPATGLEAKTLDEASKILVANK